MSGFRFPVPRDSTPPTVQSPTTPLQSLTNTFMNNKENESEVSLNNKLCTPVGSAEPVTPDFFKRPLRVVQPPSTDDLPTAYDLISWKNPPASLFTLVGGEMALCCAHWCFGVGSTTFLSGVCNFLLMCLSANFIRSCFSERWLLSSRWSGSALERVLMDRMQDTVSFVMALRDDTVCAIRPTDMLKTAIFLFLGSVVGAQVSFWKIAMLGWAALFTVPIANKFLGQKISELGKVIASKAQAPWKKLKLSRTAKFSVLSGVLLVTVVATNWSVRASLLIIFMMLIRCNVKTDEMKYFREHKVTKAVQNSPMLRSAFAATTRVTSFADDVLASAMKSAMKIIGDRTPDHED